LPAPATTRPDLSLPYRAPGTPLEELLAGIWQRLLGIEPVGIDDSFLDLGGNSLMAGQLLSHTGESLGVEVPLRDFFEAPTIAGLAAILIRCEAVSGRTEAMARLRRQIDAFSAADVQELLQARAKTT
jgi:acyl carrier protein